MKIIDFCHAELKLFWSYLGFFQKPFFRIIHALTVFLVLLQFFSSSFMYGLRGVKPEFVTILPTWYHFIAGMFLCLASLYLLINCFMRSGTRNYFPYLFKDTEQIKKDFILLKTFKIISPQKKGILFCLYGFGLVSLVLTAYSGLIWFVFRVHALRELHESLTGLVSFYIIVHAAIAIARFIYWQRTTKNKI